MANEKLDKIEKKIAQLKAQKQAIVAREKEKERKARTRRLIQIGALAEKYLDIHTPEEMEAWLKKHMASADHDDTKQD